MSGSHDSRTFLKLDLVQSLHPQFGKSNAAPSSHPLAHKGGNRRDYSKNSLMIAQNRNRFWFYSALPQKHTNSCFA